LPRKSRSGIPAGISNEIVAVGELIVIISFLLLIDFAQKNPWFGYPILALLLLVGMSL
jgi:hypothetical protein